MDNLLKLAERCEAATGPDRELDEQIALAKGLKPTVELGDPALGNHRFVPARVLPYTASLDAAMTLVPEREDWAVGSGPLLTTSAKVAGKPAVQAATPALALCAAALRARSVTARTTTPNER